MRRSSRDSRFRLGWTLALTSLAFFMVGLDALVVVTALPAIHRDLGASLDSLQWTVNAYSLAWAASITTVAESGARYGRRRWFAIGLTLFAVASAACAVAPNMAILVAARVVQGIGAGFIMPLSLTILTSAFGPERCGTIVGIWGGIAGIAVATGPLIGGAITQSLTWHWVFWLNVPLGIVAAVFSLRQLSESVGPPTKLDLVAVALVSGGAVGIVSGLVQASALGWTSAATIATLGGGLVLIASFVAWELRATAPMLPMRLFRNVSFSAANATGFFQSGAVFGGIFLVTQYFQLAVGNSPFDTGLRLLPWTAGPLLFAPLAGALSDRIGRGLLLVSGMLQAASFAWFASLASSSVEYWRLAIPMALTGIGVAMVLPVAPTAALSAVERADMGKASGVNSTLQRFGGAFGVAVATSIFAAFGSLASPTAFIAGFRPSFTIVAGLAVIGALAAFGVGNAHAVAPPPSSPDLGAAPALSTLRGCEASTEAREPGTAVRTQGGAR
jgi:EmrB/QacA subfamily drug resistance transporter